MRLRTYLAAPLVAVVLLVGCGNEDADQAADGARDQTEDAGREARAAANDAWASLRTDAERLVDQLQTSDGPKAKQELLDRCRDVLETLRKENADSAGRVDRLCTRIRDTDVTNRDVWQDIKREISQVDPGA